MIQARDVTRSYGSHRALHRVTFTLPTGSATLLVGPNGAGKTTLLRLLATLDAPTSGTLDVAGLDPARDGAALRARLGYAGHRPGVPDELTPRELLSFHGALHDLPDPQRAVDHALDRAGLASRATARCATLSHGQRRRLALARALLHDPDVLLLDEPLTGLDPASAQRALDTLRDARDAHRTLLLATHEPRRLASLATHALALRGGRVMDHRALEDPRDLEQVVRVVEGAP